MTVFAKCGVVLLKSAAARMWIALLCLIMPAVLRRCKDVSFFGREMHRGGIDKDVGIPLSTLLQSPVRCV